MKAAVIAKPVEECDLEPQKVTLIFDTPLSSSGSTPNSHSHFNSVQADIDNDIVRCVVM